MKKIILRGGAAVLLLCMLLTSASCTGGGYNGITVSAEAARLEYFVGEQIIADGLYLYVTDADGTVTEIPVTVDMLDLSGVDMSKPGQKEIPIRSGSGSATYRINVLASDDFADSVKRRLDAVFTTYNEGDYQPEMYQRLTAEYDKAVRLIGEETDPLRLRALLENAMNDMRAVMNTEMTATALSDLREQSAEKVLAYTVSNQDNYSAENYARLTELVNKHASEIRGISIDGDYDTVRGKLNSAYAKAMAELDGVAVSSYILTPAVGSPSVGEWYISGGKKAEMSDMMPPELEGTSVKLADKNGSTRFISAAYMYNEPRHSADILADTDGEASLSFWVYISDITALGSETGFFIGLSPEDVPTEGDSAGRYNIGNARRYITVDNGFVSGWNRVEIPIKSFDQRDASYQREYTQINFSLRTMGSKATAAGRTYYPDTWTDGTEVYVTDIRVVYGSEADEIINAVETQPNELHLLRAEVIASVDGYKNEQDYSGNRWKAIIALAEQAKKDIGALADRESMDARIAEFHAEADKVPTRASSGGLEVERLDYLAELDKRLAGIVPSEYSAEDHTVIVAAAEKARGLYTSADSIDALEAAYNSLNETLAKVRRTSQILVPSSDYESLGKWQRFGGTAAETSARLPNSVTGSSVVLGHKNSNLQFVCSSFTFNTVKNSTEFLSAPDGTMSLTFWFYIDDISLIGDGTTGFFICFYSAKDAASENGNRGRFNCANAKTFISPDGGFVSGWNRVSISNHAFDQRAAEYQGDYYQIAVGLRSYQSQAGDGGYEKYPASYTDKTSQMLITDLRFSYNETPQTVKQAVLETEAAG